MVEIGDDMQAVLERSEFTLEHRGIPVAVIAHPDCDQCVRQAAPFGFGVEELSKDVNIQDGRHVGLDQFLGRSVVPVGFIPAG